MIKRVKKKCKYCSELFEARRSNHIYCSTSCKTKASYKRNNYKYISGHYQKVKVIPKLESLDVPEKTDIIESIKILEDKIENISNINGVSIANAATGSAAADAAAFAVKKIFAPNSLSATKGDMIALKKELNELKKMIKSINSTKTHFFNV